MANFFIQNIQKQKDTQKRLKLTNHNFSLITSNCTGGFIYHWLGLQFRTPFINLWMTNNDYIQMLENFDDFIRTPLHEDTDATEPYPVGIGWGGGRVLFTHYRSFEEANKKWEERKKRIDCHNMSVWMTNWSGDEDILRRFDALPFENKVIFVNRPYEQYTSAVYLSGFEKEKGVGQIYKTKNFLGKRYIDEFDYVSHLNALK